MDKKELTKKVLVGAVILGAFVGALWGAASYWTGGAFQPGESDRALKNNQVLFDDQKSSLSQESGDSGDSFWEDQNANDEVSGSQQQPGFLFTPDELTPEATTAGIVGPDTGNTATGTDRPSTGIDITTRPGAATGTVIGGNTTGGTTGGSTTPTAPASSVTGSGTVSDPYQGNTVLQDPDSQKDPPSDPYFPPPTHITDDTELLDPENYFVTVSKPWSTIASLLYKGETIDKRILFNALDTYMEDLNWNRYYWDATDLDKTFRIDKISFDSEHWIDMTGDTTVTIPIEAENAYIQVSYRFSQKSDWTSYVSSLEDPFVTYPLEESRVFLLNTTLPADKKFTVDQLLNNDKDNQHMTVGQKTNLTYYLEKLIRTREGKETNICNQPLELLFPGFTENGKTVSWRYGITAGRHVLEAPESVAFDTNTYQLELRQYWTGENWALDKANGSLSYLQTLTYYKGKTSATKDGAPFLSKLQVPKYVQAVDFPYSQYLTVDTLSLPSTVLYVNTDGVPDYLDDEILYDRGLQVNKAYEVSKGNPRYTAKNGLLYNLDGTELLGVPVSKTSLTVPKNVTSVHLPYRTKLTSLTLQTKDSGALPEINLERLNKSCKLLVDKSILEDFLRSQADQLNATGLYVASTQKPNLAYTVRDGLIFRKDGYLHGILDTDTRWLSIPDTASGMEAGCLTGLDKLTMVQLPSTGESLDLKKGCFDSAPALETIICYSQAQYDAAKAVAPKGVQVVLANTQEVGGYRYLDMGNGQVMLLEVPADITEFDGTVPGAEGGTVTVTAIGSAVFTGCDSLRWVDLPEETASIGQNAFRGCASLEGVVIGAKSVMIGKDSFADCSRLRFIASNATECELLSPDLELPCDTMTLTTYSFLFCLDGAQGYNGNWTCFDKSEITGYRLVDCGGTRVLYGLLDGKAWIALRSGGFLDGDVSLPASTENICRSAFQDAVTGTGEPFQVNWPQLTGLGVVGDYAFYRSGLGKSVTLPEELTLGTYAFAYCPNLTHMTIPGTEGGIALGYSLFEGDTALESVTFGVIDPESSILAGMFNDCGNLHTLTFRGDPPDLTLLGFGFGFRFNYSQGYDDETEEANLQIIVPESLKEQYVEHWRYAFAGYLGIPPQSNYQAMWDNIQMELLDSLGMDYTDEAVTEQVDELLLTAENHVRTLLGMEKVGTATHRYRYTVDDNSYITLTGARDVGYTELTADVMDMPSGWALDYIGAGAFAQSPELYEVRLPDTLVGIYSGAFTGVQCGSGPLKIDISGDTPPELLGYSPDAPFTFGIEDGDVRLYAYGCNTDDVLKSWLLPMTGYSSLQALHDALADALTEGETPPTDEAVKSAMLEKLIAGENRLRLMLELDPISDPADLEGVTEDDILAVFQTVQVTAQLALQAPTAAAPSGETEPAPTEPKSTDPTEAPKDPTPAETTESTEAPKETEPAEKPKETEPTETASTEAPKETESAKEPPDTKPAEPETAPSEPPETESPKGSESFDEAENES